MRSRYAWCVVVYDVILPSKRLTSPVTRAGRMYGAKGSYAEYKSIQQATVSTNQVVNPTDRFDERTQLQSRPCVVDWYRAKTTVRASVVTTNYCFCTFTMFSQLEKTCSGSSDMAGIVNRSRVIRESLGQECLMRGLDQDLKGLVDVWDTPLDGHALRRTIRRIHQCRCR